MTWNKNDLDKLKAAGKIRDYRWEVVKHDSPPTGGRKVAKYFERKSKGLDFIGWNLLYWCNEKILGLEEEYKFNPSRNWRFDWAIPAIMVAVEFEGGVFDRNGSHTSFKDINRDTEKYNSAAVLGWKVLRFNASNYKTLITELNKTL